MLIISTGCYKDCSGNQEKYFIGANVENLLNLEQAGLKIKTLSKERSALFKEVRDKLINLDQNINNISDCLWLSSDLAENNLSLENFSLYILNTLAIIYYILPQCKNNTVFICDDDEQVFIYGSVLKKNGFTVELRIQYFNLVKRILGCLYQKVLYFFTGTGKILTIRILRFLNKARLEKSKLEHVDVLCINWVNDTSFKDHALFLKDRYFGDLLSSLKKMGITVEVVGKTLDFSIPFITIARSAIQKKSPFYLMQDFLGIFDLLKIFIQSFNFLCFANIPFFIHKIDFSPLWNWTCLKNALGPRIPQAMETYFSAIRLFKNTKNDNLKLIYPYENQPWEKMLALAFKTTYPKKKIYGYQHFPIASDYLTIYPSAAYTLKNLGPTILVSDSIFAENLKKEGIKNFMVLGNYRFKEAVALSQTCDHISVTDRNKKIILCSCSIEFNDSLELISKTIKIIASMNLTFREKIILIVNFHPFMSEYQKNSIKRHFCCNEIKVNFSHLNADALLKNAVLVFYNSSSICFNAAAIGIPSIFIPSDVHINLDRMPEVSIKAKSISAVSKILEKLLSHEIFYKIQSSKCKLYFDRYFIAPHISMINKIFNEVN